MLIWYVFFHWQKAICLSLFFCYVFGHKTTAKGVWIEICCKPLANVGFQVLCYKKFKSIVFALESVVSMGMTGRNTMN